MGQYLLRRVPSALLTALAASILIFVVMRLAPGSPATVIAGPDASRETIEKIEHQLGLDNSWPLQYWDWIHGLLTGHLGDSFIYDQPITELLAPRLESTLELALAATLAMSVLGIALGVYSGASRSARARGVMDATYSILLSLPPYVMSVLFILLFGVVFPILPVSGGVSVSENFSEGVRYLLLPALAVGIPQSAVIGRLLQTRIQDSLNEDYVRAAAAKGASRRRIVWIHVLRNSMSTAVVAIGIRFGSLLGGAIIVEALFARNGVGTLLISSVFDRDYFVIQNLILFAVLAAIIVQLLSEVALAILDPRIRLS